ncbi:MAG TPA: septal ring lytic transglycosylase RlpA family protein [Mycobacteriales bacterium]|nr:septal ring lytic transglycosylase RlpA family protein [Mycobacteriales bacterium]
MRRIRRPATLAVVAAFVVTTAGVVTWQAASSNTPSHRPRAATFIPLPADSSAAAGRDGRASRGGRREPPPSLTAAPTPHLTPPPASIAPAPPAPVTPVPPVDPPASQPAAPAPSPVPDPAPSTVAGGQYVPAGPSFSGEASFYGNGDGTDGGPTASGETFDANALTAASPSLPFNTLLNVCYQGQCVVVRINDRGPFVGGRILDLSARAAQLIGMEDAGVGFVTATPVKPAD